MELKLKPVQILKTGLWEYEEGYDLSKRYYVFSHIDHDCAGGLYDIDITTNDFEEAKEYAENRRKKLCSWSGVEIFDRIEGKVYIINKN